MELNKDDFQALNVIFLALVTGQVLFAGVVYYLLQDPEAVPDYILGPNQDLYLVLAYGLATVFASRFLDQMRVKSIPTLQNIAGDAFAHYRSSVILRLAVLEGGTLLVITMALITHNGQLLFLVLPLLFAFYLAKPSAEEFAARYG
ncbi:hypothetical protein QWY85_20130 [Neolewinella lacunae]|uniref:Uncharacterized protein n=1 Tax=Neolewinella lacunae TaxID=1517758 RepID=A0A923PT78_9BACT|nr:hypothetical protein [Neolewinella lacunae]MBC6996367.1 hypothetical protein [Neolewinella lacunae]MDN3636990.1 hypothetical protein [Neolewinella lacunae]